MFFFAITLLLLVPYLLLILYYSNGWNNVPYYVGAPFSTEEVLPFVSIIIAARNEETKIGDCIKSINTQTYPKNKFELIIVNDHSTDETEKIVKSFTNENIRLISLADFTENKKLNSYKKKCIETALIHATGELIVTTDADCIVPGKWIENLVSFYKEKNCVFIAAPVVFSRGDTQDSFGKKLLVVFQCLDFMTLQGITGASVSNKVHNMCNGANLAYTKKAYEAVNGFEGIDNIASGDDMLLMHKIQQRFPDNIGFLKSKDVIVETNAEETLANFFNQRIRWASKSDKYADKKIMSVLVLVYFLNVWLLILGISSFFSIKFFYLFLVTLAIKIVIELIFLFPVTKFFDRQKLLWFFIPAQPFHILYTIIAGWLGKFGNYKWKGRKVK
jgi:cellulose synthase/poly-beta-1,6-N-acetylglucosamine synthase-like glycosyltransferase